MSSGGQASEEPRRPLARWTLGIAGFILLGALLAALTEGNTANLGKAIAAVGAMAQAVVSYVNEMRKQAAEQAALVAKEAARRAEGNLRIAVDDTLAPLAKDLRDLAASPTQTRRERSEAFALRALGCALAFATADRSRASLFISDGDCLYSPDGLSIGRGDRPVSRFCRGTLEGDAVWAAATREETTFSKDTTIDPPMGWDSERERSYRSFVTVPIIAKGEVAGLLTLNAPQPGDLDETSVGMLQVIAGMLGTAFSLPGGRPRSDRA